MRHIGIEMIFLVRFGCLQIVEGRDIGMRRASAILQTARSEYGAGDARSQILGIEIREEGVHLFVRHTFLFRL